MKTPIDYFSFTSVPLKMFFDKRELAHGTAFFYTKNNHIYLVTNWHNLSGKDPQTGDYLSRDKVSPNKIIFSYYIPGTGSKEVIVESPLKINESFIWKQYKETSQVDIAVIPLNTFNIESSILPTPITDNCQTLDMAIKVGMDVFVLGFPIRSDFTGIIPVWKRATIASEPNMLVDGLSKLLLDTTTHQGMSGSPVILRSYDGYMSDSKGYIMTPGYPFTRVLGIYSGRHLSNPELGNASLGIVWKKELIDATIDKGIVGSQTLQ